MPCIGITGHSNLSSTTTQLVRATLEAELARYADAELIGVSCLARGADQVFAQAVLAVGGELEVVLPATDYREKKVKADNRADFDDLVQQATAVHTMPFSESGRDAYMAASEQVISNVDAMFAVWDGQPSDGYGGTADVVRAARDRGIPVMVVWPEDAQRE